MMNIWIGIILMNVLDRVALDDNIKPDSTGLITSTEISNVTQPNYKDFCFYSDPELCTRYKSGNASEMTSCRCYPYSNLKDSYYCCNVTDISMISSCNASNHWVYLHVYNATLRILDISNFSFQKLKSLAITDGNITKIAHSMSRAAQIKCFNVSNNYLTDINPRAFTGLQNLEVIDISNNNISRIPNLNTHRSMTVDLSGNKRMVCDTLLTMVQGSFKFASADKTFCLLNQTFNWFNSTDYVPIYQLERWKQLHSDCPKIKDHGNCICDAEQMVYETKHDKPHLLFTAKVDCSNLGLTTLPLKLPENTLSLNVSNNNITSFGNHFHSNPSYFHILKFYADNNKISSMYELEGTQFIDVFQKFYLRKNDLIKIPDYFLSNTLDNNPNGRAIYLGGNALNCDCNSAKVLRLWLLARTQHIPDYNQILCRNMPQKVVDLQELKLCQSPPHDWTDYIFYLIASEVFLLLALVTKVSYDYWVFKTAGYLPWPANKMPKLPCDWLCES